MRRAFPVVLSSPSGAGKTSIARGVVARNRRGELAHLAYSVSATTRPKRPGERHGYDYFFYTPARFQVLARAGQLLESARVYGYRYGTPKGPILKALKAGCDVIADLDIQGARSMKKLIPETVTIFIDVRGHDPDPKRIRSCPQRDELQRRLKGRRTDPPEEIRKRLACAAQELKAIPEFDYLVHNRSLDQAIDEVETIIRAERLRTERRGQRQAANSKRQREGYDETIHAD
jgi:guanylate kinase